MLAAVSSQVPQAHLLVVVHELSIAAISLAFAIPVGWCRSTVAEILPMSIDSAELGFVRRQWTLQSNSPGPNGPNAPYPSKLDHVPRAEIDG